MTFDIIKAIFLGVVEGLTEFIPISSTAHLTLTGHVLGDIRSDEEWTAFIAVIQLGTSDSISVVVNGAAGSFTDFVVDVNGYYSADPVNSAVNFTGPLVGDVTGTQGATVVSAVGGSTAAKVHTAEVLANAATSSASNNTLVKRDSLGNFAAHTIGSTGGFLQPGSGGQALRIVRGIIRGDGVTLYGTGFTSSKDGMGAYTIVFSSGFGMNVALLPALAGREDVLFLDRLVHASLVDGARLSGASSTAGANMPRSMPRAGSCAARPAAFDPERKPDSPKRLRPCALQLLLEPVFELGPVLIEGA